MSSIRLLYERKHTLMLPHGLTIVLFLIIGFIVIRILAKVYPFPCPFEVAWILENPLRQRLFSREMTLDRVSIKPGETILELGPGPGYFTFEAAQRAEATGVLFCLDIQLKMIRRVHEKAKKSNVNNVHCTLGDAGRLPFKEGSFDKAFAVTVLGEVRHRDEALKELHRVIRKGGVLSITELLLDPHYVRRYRVRALSQKVGFVFGHAQGNLFHYTMNFTKS